MADKAMEKLIGVVEDGKSRQLQAYLPMLGRFHRYSLGNVLLIAWQRPDATRVAGYRVRQQLGRQVRQSEGGIRILAPALVRGNGGPKESTAEHEEDEEEELVAFKSACIFDVSQTDGKELPSFACVKGDPGRALARLKRLVAEKGVKLDYTNAIGPADGRSDGGRIPLRTDLDPAEEFSVLVHQLSREMLHQQDGRPENRTVRETEAEAVAFAVRQAVGLDTGTIASDYIQPYDGKKETLLESLKRIRQAAGEIIEGLTAEPGKPQPILAALPVQTDRRR